MEGTFRDADLMGTMPFTRTLEDWAKFDISNRTKFDASISQWISYNGLSKASLHT